MNYKKQSNFDLNIYFEGDHFAFDSERPCEYTFDEYFENLYQVTLDILHGYKKNDPVAVQNGLFEIKSYEIQSIDLQRRIMEVIIENQLVPILINLINIFPIELYNETNDSRIESQIVDLSFRTLLIFVLHNKLFSAELLKMNFFEHFKKSFCYYSNVAQAFGFYLLSELVARANDVQIHGLLKQGIVTFSFMNLDDPLNEQNNVLKTAIYYFILNLMRKHPKPNCQSGIDKTISRTMSLFNYYQNSTLSQRNVLLMTFNVICERFSFVCTVFQTDQKLISTLIRVFQSSDDFLIQNCLILIGTILQQSSFESAYNIIKLIPWERLTRIFDGNNKWSMDFLLLVNIFSTNVNFIQFLFLKNVYQSFITKYSTFPFEIFGKIFAILNIVVQNGTNEQNVILLNNGFIKLLLNIFEINNEDIIKTLCLCFDSFCMKISQTDQFTKLVNDFIHEDGFEVISSIDNYIPIIEICKKYGIFKE